MVKTQSTGAGKRSVKRPPVRAVKATASRNRSGFMLFLRRRKLLLLTLLGLKLLAVGVLVWMHVHYYNQQKAAERAADVAYFAQLEARMNRDFGDYVRSLNPTSFETSRSCSRVSLKFQEGQLSCGVTISASFNNDLNTSFERLMLLKQSLDAKGYRQLKGQIENISKDDLNRTKSLIIRYSNLSSRNCELRAESLNLITKYEFNCYSNASDEIYTLEE